MKFKLLFLLISFLFFSSVCYGKDISVFVGRVASDGSGTNLLIRLPDLKNQEIAVVTISAQLIGRPETNFQVTELQIEYKDLDSSKADVKNIPTYFSRDYEFLAKAQVNSSYVVDLKTHPVVYYPNYGIRGTQNMHLVAGVQSPEPFWGWFYVQDETSGENFWTKPTKYPATTTSFGFDLLKDYCADVYNVAPFPVSEYAKTKVCLRPNTNYRIMAIMKIEGVLETTGGFVGYRTPSFVAPRIQNLTPVSISNKSAVLKAKLIDTGDVYVFFKVWPMRDNEASLASPKIDLDNEKIYKTMGQNSISFVAQKTVDGKELEPGKRYCYNSYAFWPRTKSVSIGERLCFTTKSSFDLAVPHYLQCVGPWSEFLFTTGERFCKDGCLDTSLSMLLAYWYNRDKDFKANWDKLLPQIASQLSGDNLVRFNQSKQATGNVPNPYTAYWFARLNGYWWNEGIWPKLKLKAIPVQTNSKQEIQDRYLAKGIPLLAYCTPSHASGRSNHFAVLMDFANSNTNNIYVSSNGKDYLTDILTNDSYYGAKRVLNAINDYNYVRTHKNAGIPDVPKCGYQYGLYTENQYYGGLVAIVPIDLELDNEQSF